MASSLRTFTYILIEMFQRLIKYIQDIDSISTEEIELISACLETRSFRKNEFLLRKGEICRYIYFVNYGCLRTYSVGDATGECTRCLAFEACFCTVFTSFLPQTSSPEFIQALEPSEVVLISRHHFQLLREKIPAWEKIYVLTLEKICMNYAARIESLLSMSTIERFHCLLEQDPVIVQRLSNKVVASYLGVTQESLSRLKSKK